MVLNKIYAWLHSKSPNQDQATPSPAVADKPVMIDGWDIESHIAAQSIATSVEATRKRDIETETAAEEFITHHYAYQAKKPPLIYSVMAQWWFCRSLTQTHI